MGKQAGQKAAERLLNQPNNIQPKGLFGVAHQLNTLPSASFKKST
jgi:hypothetical protein